MRQKTKEVMGRIFCLMSVMSCRAIAAKYKYTYIAAEQTYLYIYTQNAACY